MLVAIIDVQNWRQFVRDRLGNVLAERQVSVLPNEVSISYAVNDFTRFVVQNNGDLKTSIEKELQVLKSQLSELLGRMNSSDNANEIRKLAEPMNVTATLVSYLQQLLEPMRQPQLEGALHIVSYANPDHHAPRIYAVTFAPYLAPGGAMKPRIISGREALENFLSIEVQLGRDRIPVIFADLDRNGTVSWPQVRMSQDRMKELQLA
jgi:hypothetical protein